MKRHLSYLVMLVVIASLAVAVPALGQGQGNQGTPPPCPPNSQNPGGDQPCGNPNPGCPPGQERLGNYCEASARTNAGNAETIEETAALIVQLFNALGTDDLAELESIVLRFSASQDGVLRQAVFALLPKKNKGKGASASATKYRRVIIFAGRHDFNAGESGTVVLNKTRRGRNLLNRKGGKRLKIQMLSAFTPEGGVAVSKKQGTTLSGRGTNE